MSTAIWRAAILGLAALLAVLLPATSESAAARDPETACPKGQVVSVAYEDGSGLRVEGGKCIPANQVPGDATYWYEYSKVCDERTGNNPNECAHLQCDTAAEPARVFGVIRITIDDPSERVPMGAGCYTINEEPPEITPGMVLKELEKVPIAPGGINVQPPNGKTLINFKTIVSTDAVQFEKDVPILGQNVHLWIRPVAFTWDYGDGTEVTRDDKGIPWTPGTEAEEITDAYTYHEYLVAGDHQLGLTVSWTADFAVGDAPPEPIRGTVEITSPPVPITALEARPYLVG